MEKRLSRLLEPTLCSRSPLNGVWLWLPVFLALCALDISPASSQSIDGTILRPRFVSASSGETIRFNIYLPAAYDDGTDRYAVIYQLHGAGGNQSSNNRTIASHIEQARAAGLLPPVIVVFPNGQRDSWWADSKDGRVTVETDVIREVIPMSTRTTEPRRRAAFALSKDSRWAASARSNMDSNFRSCFP